MKRFGLLTALGALAWCALGIRQSAPPRSSASFPALREAARPDLDQPRIAAAEVPEPASFTPPSILPQAASSSPPEAGTEPAPASATQASVERAERRRSEAAAHIPVARMAAPSSAAADGAALVLDLEPGIRLPIVLLGLNPELPGPVRQAGERLAVQFGSDLASSPAADGVQDSEIPPGPWEKARSKADEVFRALYGLEAFNQAGLEAAWDALASR